MSKRPKDPGTATTALPQGNDNPAWFKPVMFGLMLLGLAWILTYYVSSSQLPVAAIGSWNIAVGFGIMFVGFLMTTRWK
jgi:thiol:disulfide interchange protein